MTKTSLLDGEEDASDHLKASDGGLDKFALTTLIAELIHHSLCAAEGSFVPVDASSLEFGKDGVFNWKAECSEELIDLSVVGIVVSLVEIALQCSEQAVVASLDCESPVAGVTARQVDVVFVVFEVVGFGAWEREDDATQVVDVLRTDESEPLASSSIKVVNGRRGGRLRL